MDMTTCRASYLGSHVVAPFLKVHDSIIALVLVAAKVRHSVDLLGLKFDDVSQLVGSDRVRASAGILVPPALRVTHAGPVPVDVVLITAPALPTERRRCKGKVLQKGRHCKVWQCEVVANGRCRKGKDLQKAGVARGKDLQKGGCNSENARNEG